MQWPRKKLANRKDLQCAYKNFNKFLTTGYYLNSINRLVRTQV